MKFRRMSCALVAALGLATAVAVSPLSARPSQPSAGFGTSGVITHGYGEDSSMSASALQSDGKTVVVFDEAFGGSSHGIVRRYRSKGAPDLTFGTGGAVDLGLDTGATSVALGPDGLIYVVGSRFALGERGVIIWRLTRTGVLDTTFSGDGWVAPDPLGTTNEIPVDIAVDAVGRVVAVATTGLGNIVYRVLPSGDVDTSFSGDGKSTFMFGDANNFPRAVTVASNGKVIVVGSRLLAFEEPDRIEAGTAIARLTRSGELDTTFSDDGQMEVGRGLGRNLDPSDVELDSAGRIVVVGTQAFFANDKTSAYAMRVLRNGALDTSFSGDGVRIFGFIDRVGSSAGAVDVQSNGAILVSGEKGCTHVGVARLRPGGGFDRTFSRDGVRLYRFGTAGNSCVRGSGITSTGRRLVISGLYSGVPGGIGLLSLDLS
jgi:uncharacterized delta-60 repeat protein